jgi:hypothetical protein
MKWKSRVYLKDREYEKRTVKRFLLFPKCLYGKHWRWMEYAWIKQRIERHDLGGSGEWGRYSWKWTDVEFVDAATTKGE